MTKSHQRQIDRLRRVIGFGVRHQREFDSTSRAPALFGEAVDLLNALEAQLTPNRNWDDDSNDASEKQSAAQELRAHLDAISATARLLEKQNGYYTGRFIVGDRRQKSLLAPTAHQFIEDAAPVLDEFWDYEMAPGFLDDLKASLARYESTESHNPAAQDCGSAALDSLLERSQNTVDALDVAMSNKYRALPVSLAEWNEARELGYTPRKRRETANA